uniref:FHL1/2/3/5 N-terminal LIM domain-containing protein n=1 Tax=Anolis carolinensis TaxID=28377 RepID=A0A803T8V2_ANOCA
MASDMSNCYHCMASLCGKQFAMKEDHPYCVKCYDSLFANFCEDCKKPIECDSKVRQLWGIFNLWLNCTSEPTTPSVALLLEMGI